MIMNGEHMWLWKEVVVIYFKVQSRWPVDYAAEVDKEGNGLYGYDSA
jgi:hypothetical protein